jgi:2-polyprenyl-3-methyl-5-hydroxy-6-metoxy-1,4-benzoquinol methylase
MPDNTQAASPRSLSQEAGDLFRVAPPLTRAFQRYRPQICPFDAVIESVPKGSRVLDVGCGVGLLLALLARRGRACASIGFDSSERAIELANAMLKAHASETWVREVSFQHRAVEAGYPEGQFDAVVMIDVMHHVPPMNHREALIGAAARVAPGGLLVYKDMCLRPRWRAAANRMHDLTVARQWIHQRPIGQIEAWALDAGLRLRDSRDIACLWYGHELRVFRRPLAGTDNGD